MLRSAQVFMTASVERRTGNHMVRFESGQEPSNFSQFPSQISYLFSNTRHNFMAVDKKIHILQRRVAAVLKFTSSTGLEVAGRLLLGQRKSMSIT
jgi:hypothetical protein